MSEGEYEDVRPYIPNKRPNQIDETTEFAPDDHRYFRMHTPEMRATWRREDERCGMGTRSHDAVGRIVMIVSGKVVEGEDGGDGYQEQQGSHGILKSAGVQAGGRRPGVPRGQGAAEEA